MIDARDLVAAEIAAWRRRDAVLGDAVAVGRSWRILVVLYRAQLDRRDLTISALANIGGPFTTGLRVLDRLRKLGLVSREASDGDRRTAILRLTPEGVDKVAICFGSEPRVFTRGNLATRLAEIELQLAELRQAYAAAPNV